MPLPLDDLLRTALGAAHDAAELIRRAWGSGIAVRYKGDDSPVTAADEAAEAVIRERITRDWPGHGFLGEESGAHAQDAEFLWLVDPIDGTKSFVRGMPVFSTQIALMHEGELVLGVSCAPCWPGGGDLVHAVRGGGAWRNGQRLRVADTDRLERCTLSTGNLGRLAASPAWPRFGALVGRLHRLRGYGDFLHYHWLADGRIDAVLESDVNILDIAALSVIVREAGGVFTDLCGRPVGLTTTSVLAAVPALHGRLLEALAYED